MTSSIRWAAIACALLLASGAASAREPDEWGPYVGFDMGTTSFNVHKAELDALSEVPAAASTLDRSDFGISLAVGFRFSQYLAVEAAYLDLGSYSYRVEDEDGIAQLSFGSRGPALSVIGALPINDTWSLEARAGGFLGNSKLRGWVALTVDAEDGFELFGAGGSDATLLLGAGVVGSFGGNWVVRLGYDYIDEAAAIPATETNPGVNSRAGRVSLGIRYRF
jgi:OmpA-OmpF porin, OOP family